MPHRIGGGVDPVCLEDVLASALSEFATEVWVGVELVEGAGECRGVPWRKQEAAAG